MVSERLKATSNAEHYKKKHADEEATIKDAEEVANATEAELVVRVLSLPTCALA